MNSNSSKERISFVERLRRLWHAFLFLVACALVLGLIAGMWYLDHVRFVWP